MRYLCEVLESGEEGGRFIEVEARNEREVWKYLYEEECGGDEELSSEEYRDYIESDGDIVLIFIYNVSKKEMIYMHDMWGY